MMNASVLGLIGALAIGGAAGFIMGKNTASGPEVESEDAGVARPARRSGSPQSPGFSGSSDSTGSRGGGVSGLRVDDVAEALALPGQNNRLRALMNYYAGLAPSQFQEEADKLQELPWSERIMIGYLLFARWGEEDPMAAMAYTKTMGFSGMFVKRTVMQSWASKHPHDAADYFSNNASEFNMGAMMGGRGRRGSAASVIAMEWAREDSTGAMSWAQSLQGADQSDAMRGLFQQMATEDPARAAGMLSSIADNEARISAQNSIAREWGNKDWGAVKTWIGGLPTDQQQEATAQALRGLSDRDPAAAAAEIGTVSLGDELGDTIESISRKWGREDPQAAANWVMQTGDEIAQAESMGSVISSWVVRDPVAALEFVNGQPEGGVRDSAASSYVIANQGGDIQQNLRLAETIIDESRRRRAIGITVTSWMRQDKDAAIQYVDTTEALSDQSRERIKRFAQAGGHSGKGWR